MSSIELKYLITALVDNEITDEKTRSIVLEKVNSDKDLRFDFLVQQRMKFLVSRSKLYPAPETVRRKIIRRIKNSDVHSSLNYNFSSAPRIWFYSTAAVIMIAVLLIIFNRPPSVELPGTSTGKNMLFEASNNFTKIKSGDIKPQFISDDPEEINSFFKREGIVYSTFIPEFTSLKIGGAVVSEENGYKLAHHVYTTGKNELVYVFQVSEKYFDEDIMSLPPDIKQNLELNNCYGNSDGGINSVFTTIGSNIFAVVSDLPVKEIESLFCSIK
jgi:hypothetical protein